MASSRVLAIVVAVVIILAVAVAVASSNVWKSGVQTSHTEVTVSGTVKTIMNESVPVTVVFTDEAGRNTTTPVNAGTYSVILESGHDYAVNLTYRPTPGGNTTSCNSSSFSLPAQSGNFLFNVFC
jgi:hypothetical protein